MAAQIVPDPLDWIELGAIRRQRQQSDIAGHHQSMAVVPLHVFDGERLEAVIAAAAAEQKTGAAIGRMRIRRHDA